MGETTAGGTNRWTEYFNGPVWMSVGWTLSDESLKHEISDIENASEILNQLAPKK